MARVGRGQSFKPIVMHGKTPALITSAPGDTLGASETFLKQVNKLFADALSLVEARALQVNKRVADTVALTENLGVVRIAVKAVGDTLSLTESLIKQVNKTVGETVGLSETFVKQTNKVLAETISLTEARVLSISRHTADSLGLTEWLNAIKVLVRSYDDTLGLSETFTKRINKPLAETVALAEARMLTTLKREADTLGLTEGLAAVRTSILSMPETVAWVESVAMLALRRVTDALGLTESLATAVVSGSSSRQPPSRMSIGMRIGL